MGMIISPPAWVVPRMLATKPCNLNAIDPDDAGKESSKADRVETNFSRIVSHRVV
jgi:hypothetical protein